MRHQETPGIRVYLVHDEALIRESLQVVLDLEPEIKVIGQATDAEGALSDLAARSADVLLMNVRSPGTDGLNDTRRLKETVPNAAIIMLSSYNGAHVGAALEADSFLSLVRRRCDHVKSRQSLIVFGQPSHEPDRPMADTWQTCVRGYT